MVVLYVGTYTQVLGHVAGQGKGIYAFELDTTTGEATPLSTTDNIGENPTFLAASATTLYAVNEMEDPDAKGVPTGYAQAFRIEGPGKLQALSKHETHGGATCHVSLSPDAKFVLAANYSGGSFSVFPVQAGGSLQASSDFHQFHGSTGVVADRQEAPHIHSAWWFQAKNGNLCAYACDLGNDHVLEFVLEAGGKLVPHPECHAAKRSPGAGPRHLALHPSRGVAYVVDELASTVGVHLLDVETGAISEKSVQDISTLPAEFKEFSLGADIHVSTCGNYLFASNRGHNSVVCYRIQADGKLEVVGFTSSRGKCPRNFMVVEKLVLVANQDTHTIEVFSFDPATGALTFTGNSISCPSPVTLCIPPVA